ncbi:WAS/WASL-interacting protein family member 2-like [Penaeus monodon]|uniref:WAS/WASL-interacting protein family member 2-like n=1 Tax=Penaeus monodon TaxID=6687 RepID=UPI0018A74203|nr:WAS/WASL-interacting protein family member 2-like [Penaeus monodon]
MTLPIRLSLWGDNPGGGDLWDVLGDHALPPLTPPASSLPPGLSLAPTSVSPRFLEAGEKSRQEATFSLALPMPSSRVEMELATPLTSLYKPLICNSLSAHHKETAFVPPSKPPTPRLIRRTNHRHYFPLPTLLVKSLRRRGLTSPRPSIDTGQLAMPPLPPNTASSLPPSPRPPDKRNPPHQHLHDFKKVYDLVDPLGSSKNQQFPRTQGVPPPLAGRLSPKRATAVCVGSSLHPSATHGRSPPGDRRGPPCFPIMFKRCSPRYRARPPPSPLILNLTAQFGLKISVHPRHRTCCPPTRRPLAGGPRAANKMAPIRARTDRYHPGTVPL